MDKYQKYLMNTARSYFAYINEKEKNIVKCYTNDKIMITQDEDITVGGYFLYIANKSFERVFAIKGEQQIALKAEFDPIMSSKSSGEQRRFFLPLSFDNRIESIKIVFNNNLADDLIIPVIYVEANKEKYYAKVAQEQNAKLLAKAQIKHSTGADLVNIYFQPCCDTYAKTEIELYLANGNFSRPSSMCVTFFTPQLLGGQVEQLIGKYVIEDGSLFKSISGLAKRVYGYKVRQFDANGKILCESDFAFFSIK